MFHVPPVFPERVTELPAQKVVLLFAEIDDAVGKGLIVIGNVEVLPLLQALEGVTEILPALLPIKTVIEFVFWPELIELPEGTDQL